MVSDTTFREQACEKTKALLAATSRSASRAAKPPSRSGARCPRRTSRISPAVRRPDPHTGRTETWHPAHADGSRDADIQGEISGTPVMMKGTAGYSRGRRQGGRSIDLEVTVAVPLIGRRMEPFVVDAIRSGLQKEHELGRSWHDGLN